MIDVNVRKANALALVLRRCEVSVELAAIMNETHWKMIERIAGVKRSSTLTRDHALDVLWRLLQPAVSEGEQDDRCERQRR